VEIAMDITIIKMLIQKFFFSLKNASYPFHTVFSGMGTGIYRPFELILNSAGE
jgi:hypothetical protein